MTTRNNRSCTHLVWITSELLNIVLITAHCLVSHVPVSIQRGHNSTQHSSESRSVGTGGVAVSSVNFYSSYDVGSSGFCRETRSSTTVLFGDLDSTPQIHHNNRGLYGLSWWDPTVHVLAAPKKKRATMWRGVLKRKRSRDNHINPTMNACQNNVAPDVQQCGNVVTFLHAVVNRHALSRIVFFLLWLRFLLLPKECVTLNMCDFSHIRFKTILGSLTTFLRFHTYFWWWDSFIGSLPISLVPYCMSFSLFRNSEVQKQLKNWRRQTTQRKYGSRTKLKSSWNEKFLCAFSGTAAWGAILPTVSARQHGLLPWSTRFDLYRQSPHEPHGSLVDSLPLPTSFAIHSCAVCRSSRKNSTTHEHRFLILLE